MNNKYPIKFEPILKERIWGGEKLATLLNKKSQKSNIGESWELSDVEGDTSVVANGALKGSNLKELIKKYKGDLVGQRVYKRFGDKFPLLIKFIDAKEALSIQLHPNDELAQKRHNSFGKTEMWYIMQAEKDAELIIGFKKDSDKEEYLHHLKNKTLLEILNVDKVKKGDVYFIPTGRVHAIGAGVLLAEIQQTSDITYRVYDWDRQHTNGSYRELHTELALDAIDYKAHTNYKTDYIDASKEGSNIIDCQYFTTNNFPVKGTVYLNHKDKDSFVIYLCVDGEAGINDLELKQGETVLIPASLKELTIQSEKGAKLLEVYIK